ncbi:hypothetical protein [Amycolatopsis sp. 195334CR]|nr:hypothetical protein [Amycolatopsis sp. 195334CR]
MFTTIMTWVGAMFGVAVLLVMAAGAFFVDFDDTADRKVKNGKS